MSIVSVFLFGSSSIVQTPYYYYSQGEKRYLNLDKSRVFVSVADTSQLNLTLDIKIKKSSFRRDIPKERQVEQGYAKRYWQELSFQDDLSASRYQGKIALMKQNNRNAVIAPYFTNQSGEKIGLSNFLYVKLKVLGDTVILKRQAMNYNAVVVCQDRFMPLWFVVSVTSASNYNAMELANIFYESGLFQSAEPDLMVENLLACANDTYFGNQWGLNNTGQNGGTPGIDIKACNAWQISTGSNVIVAVLDHGIDLTHPDLIANIFPQSYDTENGGTSPSILRGEHGTACAGIVGAVKNNGKGISGVAPNCKLMSVSNSLSSTSILAKQQLAGGINWAWQHGADIISNSWGHNDLNGGGYISDAIAEAVTHGRNGKGCIVIFCSHNQGSAVVYPANLPNVIAVGSITPTGQRVGTSNYGENLDVVAPVGNDGILTLTMRHPTDFSKNHVQKVER